MQHVSFYKKGYPRPQLVRDNYMLLNGQWDFAFDEEGKGLSDGYINGFTDKLKINVPFAYQTAMSGIGIEKRVDRVWYSRTVSLTQQQCSGDVLIHFEGSDYETSVWANGKFLGRDNGGYHRLTFNATGALHEGDNIMVVMVTDDYSVEKPRGKQRWKDENFGCWYTDTTGIFKTVWMEFVAHKRLDNVLIEGNLDAHSVAVSYNVLNCDYVNEDIEVKATVTYKGEKVCEVTCPVTSGRSGMNIWLGEEVNAWQVGEGNVYELNLQLIASERVEDSVDSYFGLRKIEARDGKIYLNGKELYQKLVLDQGYWKGSDLTPPSEEALVSDITDMLAMGFNGARKHQKVEDERFLYYADMYGYIVWAEMPSMYKNTENSRNTFKREWKLAVNQQRNHPCVLVWVPFNESWGIEDILFDKTVQDFVNEVYHETKQMDNTRLVVTNDGWEHTISDILTIHHYEQDGEKLHSYFDTMKKCCQHVWQSHHKGAFANGYRYNGQPIMISEFGGTAFVKDTVGNNWGYGQGVTDNKEFLQRFDGLIKAIDSLPYSCGYCYTQVTDVQHEVNGLLDFEHKSKFDKKQIKEILNRHGR